MKNRTLRLIPTIIGMLSLTFCLAGKGDPPLKKPVSQPAKQENIQICHTPPGNPGNATTIWVSANAVSAHLAHGDRLGSCEAEQDPCLECQNAYNTCIGTAGGDPDLELQCRITLKACIYGLECSAGPAQPPAEPGK